VALQDPYCAWDKIAGKCRSHGAPRWGEENYFYQSVATGVHAACPSGKGKDSNIGEQGPYRDDMTYDSHRPRKDGEIINIMQEKDYNENRPHITPEIINAQYTVETLVMAVLAGAIFAVLVGFVTGYFCGRRCHKDEDDNLPYPGEPIANNVQSVTVYFIAEHPSFQIQSMSISSKGRISIGEYKSPFFIGHSL
jgi:semaphorin 6